MIKKTVNQDDIETYHLYFTDDAGAPGTDMTFLTSHKFQRERKGQIVSLGLASGFQRMLL